MREAIARAAFERAEAGVEGVARELLDVSCMVCSVVGVTCLNLGRGCYC